MMRNFNSRLRKETNFNVPIAALLSIISIHVSVRRRTQKSNLHYIYIKISTHVSVRRRTMRCHPRPSESCDFNSRLREETNPAEPTTSFSTKLISNHVSARRRTPFFKCSLNALSVLQLTSSQRDEHFSSFNSLRIVYFNSRLCKETNAAFALLSPSATISIHVSARRRTKIITQIKQIYLISTHVSARRRT